MMTVVWLNVAAPFRSGTFLFIKGHDKIPSQRKTTKRFFKTKTGLSVWYKIIFFMSNPKITWSWFTQGVVGIAAERFG
jgi:hypothetical protein